MADGSLRHMCGYIILEDFRKDEYKYDESNSLWYELKGDYYFPCLTLPESENKPVEIWGQRHKRYLQEHWKIGYIQLLTSGRLNSYLAEIDQQAKERMELLMEQMKQDQGITEQFKAENTMEWVGRMNNIWACAMEIVNAEIIYV